MIKILWHDGLGMSLCEAAGEADLFAVTEQRGSCDLGRAARLHARRNRLANPQHTWRPESTNAPKRSRFALAIISLRCAIIASASQGGPCRRTSRPASAHASGPRVSQVLIAERLEHWRKPDEAADALERLLGPVRRIELFARHTRVGSMGERKPISPKRKIRRTRAVRRALAFLCARSPYRKL
ncbi:MAG: hypothetical protein JOY71_29480 [Acetobacteraceae bacterium]|nr:hypothetical protein [Acetobacteraceae bacterium]